MKEYLNVFGVTNDGKLWRTALTIQGATGTWGAWEDMQTQGAGDHSPFIRVDSAFISRLLGGEFHVCGITDDGKLLHTVASAPGWEPFEDITTQIGSNWGEFLDVAITDVDEELHLCILAQTAPGEQHILHTILHKDGTWDRVQDVNTALLTGLPGSFISIDCAGVGVDLHVCGVTGDGKLWHTIYSQRIWTPFEDVGALSTNAPGPFTAVTIAEGDTDLHVLAQVGADLWHTMRSSNPPGWQSTFDNVKTQAGDPGSLSSADCTGGNAGSNLLHVCSLTDDGKLWHAIRFSNPLLWSNFEEVTNTTAGVPGPFNDICIAALVDRASVFNLDVCTNKEAWMTKLCYVIARSNNAGQIGSLRGQVQSLLGPPCNITPPPGCL